MMGSVFRVRDAARLAAAALAILVVPACTAKRPVLYPNATLTSVEPAVVEADVDACLDLAEQYGADTDSAGRIAGESVEGAAIGGAAGAVGGAIFGNPARGAAFGAATGATARGVRSLFRARNPDPLYVRFVDTCLRRKGYEPIGWR